MREDAERAVLERFVAGQRKPVTGKPMSELSSTAKRLRLVADERIGRCPADQLDRVFKLIASAGSGLEHAENEIAVLAPCGWLKMNRAVLSASRAGEGKADPVEIHFRAAALEGRISQRSAVRLLDRIAQMISPHLIAPMHSVQRRGRNGTQ